MEIQGYQEFLSFGYPVNASACSQLLLTKLEQYFVLKVVVKIINSRARKFYCTKMYAETERTQPKIPQKLAKNFRRINEFFGCAFGLNNKKLKKKRFDDSVNCISRGTSHSTGTDWRMYGWTSWQAWQTDKTCHSANASVGHGKINKLASAACHDPQRSDNCTQRRAHKKWGKKSEIKKNIN